MSNESLDAGDIGLDHKHYRVVHTHGHDTLLNGDVVVMAIAPNNQNILVRTSDFTAHSIYGKHEQYVHLEVVT